MSREMEDIKKNRMEHLENENTISEIKISPYGINS